MAAYRQVYDSCHLQADCQEPGSAPEPYARWSSMGYLYLFTIATDDVTERVVVVVTDAGRRVASLFGALTSPK